MILILQAKVAPHVGAWIETCQSLCFFASCLVAPHVGAWIETKSLFHKGDMVLWSHPMWVRGLKQQHINQKVWNLMSHPMWVRGLKPIVCGTLYP